MRVLDNLSYDGTPVSVDVGHYGNGRLAIELMSVNYDENSEERYLTITVNLVDEDCPEDEVWIKEWSENEGVTEWAVANDILEEAPTARAASGHVTVCRHRLTKRFQQLIAEALVREGERSRR